MKKVINGIESRVHRFDDQLHRKLDGLSPKKRLTVVLALFAVFALCAFLSIGTALFRIGRYGKRQLEIKHIKQIGLPKKQDSINTLKQYNYGTEESKSNTQHTGKE